MPKTREEFDKEEFKSKLEAFSRRMRAGDYYAYYNLKNFLEPYKNAGIFELRGLLPISIFTTTWILTMFMFNELEDSFGGDSNGYPVKEGGPLIELVIKNLGHFIQDSFFSPAGAIIRFYDAFTAYAELVEIKNDKMSSYNPEEWNKL